MEVDGPQSVKWHEIEWTVAKLDAHLHQIERPEMKLAVHFLSSHKPMFVHFGLVLPPMGKNLKSVLSDKLNLMIFHSFLQNIFVKIFHVIMAK